MSDYISREEAMAYPLSLENYEKKHVSKEFILGVEAYREYIESLNSKYIPTGRWIPVDSFSAFGGDEEAWMAHGNPVAYYCCSSCKEQAYAGEDGESLLTDYCPHCGAKMLGIKE